MAIIINCNQSLRLALCFLALAFCGLAPIVDCRHLLRQEEGEVIRSVRSVDTGVRPPICVLKDVQKTGQDRKCCGLSVSWSWSGDHARDAGMKDIYLTYEDGLERTQRAICYASGSHGTKSDCMPLENSNINGFSIQWICASANNCNIIDDKIHISVFLRKDVDINIPSFDCSHQE